MVQYVEFLRAKRATTVVAVILGLILLAAIVLRVYAFTAHDPSAWVADMRSSPTAHVTTQNLPDGSIRTVIDDPAKRTHAVVTQQGRHFRIDVVEPAGSSDHHDTVMLGNMNMNENSSNGMAHITMTYDRNMTIPLGFLFLASIPFGLLVATMLGGVLAKENDGHLELAWTKPASRERMALDAIAIDAGAIVLAELLAIAIYVLCILLFGVPSFTGDQVSPGLALLFTLVAPVSWFAALTAWSASLKSHLGLVIGLGWPAALIIPQIARATANLNSTIGHAFHGVFAALAYVDPITYMSIGNGKHANALGFTLGWSVVALALLGLFYIATSVLQWRRVEA